MNKRLMSLATLGLLAALSLLALQLPEQTLEDEDAYLDFLDIDITILSNSDIRIVETQKYVFQHGTFRYGYRWIPLDEVDSIDGFSVYEDGHAYTQKPPGPAPIDLNSEDIEAIGIDAYIFSAWTEGNRQWIDWWYPKTTGGSRTFEIQYLVHGGLNTYQNSIQLNWQAIFMDRGVTINRARVTVRLPEDVSPTELDIESSGIQATSRIIDDRTIEFITGTVPPNKKLDVTVTFPRRIIEAMLPTLPNENS